MARKPNQMSKTILISLSDPEVSRVAVMENGVLQQFYFEKAGQAKHVNNIYKGKVVNVEPSIDAAFLDLGEERNGFLHESDVLDGYGDLFEERLDGDAGLAPTGSNGQVREGVEESSPPPSRRSRPKRRSISGLVNRGQEVVVQVTKDSIGNKGPTLSTNVSVPGRYLVLMPSLHRWGVSRKIKCDDERKRLRSVMQELEPPEGMGFIVRTAGTGKTKSDLAKDLRYLLKLWKVIQRRVKNLRGPALIYQESDLVTRIMRDTYAPDVTEVVVDSEAVAKKCRDFLRIFSPRALSKVLVHQGRKPLFYHYRAEGQIEQMFDRRIELKSGGSLVIDQTEALVAIDVNSGKYKQEEHLEETAFRINMEAVTEIARQIRLRDLGGVIINDLIDMREEGHRRDVLKAFRTALKEDRARTKVVKISELGIIEMTRQRIWPNMDRTFLKPCPHCGGEGHVKTEDYLVQSIMRKLRFVLGNGKIAGAEVLAGATIADRLQNDHRKSVFELESGLGKWIRITPDATQKDSHFRILSVSEDGKRAPAKFV